MELTENPAYPRVTNALLSYDIVEEDYTQVDIVHSEAAQQIHSTSSSVAVNPAHLRVPNSCDIAGNYNTQVDSNEATQSSHSSSLTVNPAYPRVTNALSYDIVEEDYTQVDIDLVSNERAESSSLTVNPAYPRVTNALLSCDTLEDYTQVDIVSNETSQTRYSSSSSELSYVEVQPVLEYEEIEDNIVSGVRSEQNCAYNITAEDPPPTYEEVVRSYEDVVRSYEEVVRSRTNSLEDNNAYNTVDGVRQDYREVYEVIPEIEEEENTEETYTPRGIRALCGFWQGRVEIAIRLIILTLGLIVLVLPIMGAVTLRNTNAGLALYLITLFLSITCCPQFIISCVELGMLLARICSKKSLENFLTWDMLQSGILCILYLISCGGAATFLGLWSVELIRLQSLTQETGTRRRFPADGFQETGSRLQRDTGGTTTEIGIFATLTVACLLSTAFYLTRACWIRAAIKRKWDEKNAANAVTQL